MNRKKVVMPPNPIFNSYPQRNDGETTIEYRFRVAYIAAENKRIRKQYWEDVKKAYAEVCVSKLFDYPEYAAKSRLGSGHQGVLTVGMLYPLGKEILEWLASDEGLGRKPDYKGGGVYGIRFKYDVRPDEDYDLFIIMKDKLMDKFNLEVELVEKEQTRVPKVSKATRMAPPMVKIELEKIRTVAYKIMG